MQEPSSRTASRKEVADKVVDLLRSAHALDVFCLALANVEAGSWIDENFPWLEKNLELPFGLEVLSPRLHRIKGLFACHPDLYARQYTDTAPNLSAEQRTKEIAGFEAWLREATNRARARQRRPWQIVIESAIPLDDDPADAASYLRGLGTTAPWEVAARDWAVFRRSSVEPLLARILLDRPGFDFTWLVGAGGEGKSTVMRQIAWAVSTQREDWLVLWTDPTMRAAQAEFPISLLETLDQSKNVLLCVDGSEGLDNVRRLRQDVPEAEIQILDRLVAHLTANLVPPDNWEELGIFPSRTEHRQAILRIFDRIEPLLAAHPEIDRARLELG